MSDPRIRIKICGLTRGDEAVACLEAGADLIGLNFHSGSPRYVGVDQAEEILTTVGRPDQVVGVFVDRSPAEVAVIARALGLTTIQLHGDEPPEDVVALAEYWIIRAFRLGTESDVSLMQRYLQRCQDLGRLPDAVLVDASVSGHHGGTGTRIAPGILSLVPQLPRLVLAGGIQPANVAELVVRHRPWMVDVASGVESSPGRKDLQKVSELIRRVRNTWVRFESVDESVDKPEPRL